MVLTIKYRRRISMKNISFDRSGTKTFISEEEFSNMKNIVLQAKEQLVAKSGAVW